MGDTIVKGVSDMTLKFEEITVLPGEGQMKRSLREAEHKLTNGKLNKAAETTAEEPPGGIYLANEIRDPEKGEKETTQSGAARGTDALAKEVEDEELDEAALARQGGDKLSEDIHLYHYLLVKEIRNVMSNINQVPPRKYSYSEWTWFLRLMGEYEDSNKFHRKPRVDPTGDESDKGLQLQTAVGGASDDDEVKKWSWLGTRSPLMGDKGEAEWVLERLSMTLEKQLKSMREKQRKEAKGEGGPGMGDEQQNQASGGHSGKEPSGHEDSGEGSGSQQSADRAAEREGERKNAEKIEDAGATVDKGLEATAKKAQE
jgi:potassium channel subfamily K